MTWVFVVAAGLQVTGLFLDRRLMPFVGTMALAALLALALASPVTPGARRWPRRAGLGGLVLLTVTAALVDARTGGYGWPAEFGEGGDGSTLAESAAMTPEPTRPPSGPTANHSGSAPPSRSMKLCVTNARPFRCG